MDVIFDEAKREAEKHLLGNLITLHEQRRLMQGAGLNLRYNLIKCQNDYRATYLETCKFFKDKFSIEAMKIFQQRFVQLKRLLPEQAEIETKKQTAVNKILPEIAQAIGLDDLHLPLDSLDDPREHSIIQSVVVGVLETLEKLNTDNIAKCEERIRRTLVVLNSLEYQYTSLPKQFSNTNTLINYIDGNIDLPTELDAFSRAKVSRIQRLIPIFASYVDMCKGDVGDVTLEKCEQLATRIPRSYIPYSKGINSIHQDEAYALNVFDVMSATNRALFLNRAANSMPKLFSRKVIADLVNGLKRRRKQIIGADPDDTFFMTMDISMQILVVVTGAMQIFRMLFQLGYKPPIPDIIPDKLKKVLEFGGPLAKKMGPVTLVNAGVAMMIRINPNAFISPYFNLYTLKSDSLGFPDYVVFFLSNSFFNLAWMFEWMFRKINIAELIKNMLTGTDGGLFFDARSSLFDVIGSYVPDALEDAVTGAFSSAKSSDSFYMMSPFAIGSIVTIAMIPRLLEVWQSRSDRTYSDEAVFEFLRKVRSVIENVPDIEDNFSLSAVREFARSNETLFNDLTHYCQNVTNEYWSWRLGKSEYNEFYHNPMNFPLYDSVCSYIQGNSLIDSIVVLNYPSNLLTFASMPATFVLHELYKNSAANMYTGIARHSVAICVSCLSLGYIVYKNMRKGRLHVKRDMKQIPAHRQTTIPGVIEADSVIEYMRAWLNNYKYYFSMSGFTGMTKRKPKDSSLMSMFKIPGLRDNNLSMREHVAVSFLVTYIAYGLYHTASDFVHSPQFNRDTNEYAMNFMSPDLMALAMTLAMDQLGRTLLAYSVYSDNRYDCLMDVIEIGSVVRRVDNIITKVLPSWIILIEPFVAISAEAGIVPRSWHAANVVTRLSLPYLAPYVSKNILTLGGPNIQIGIVHRVLVGITIRICLIWAITKIHTKGDDFLFTKNEDTDVITDEYIQEFDQFLDTIRNETFNYQTQITEILGNFLKFSTSDSAFYFDEIYTKVKTEFDESKSSVTPVQKFLYAIFNSAYISEKVHLNTSVIEYVRSYIDGLKYDTVKLKDLYLTGIKNIVEWLIPGFFDRHDFSDYHSQKVMCFNGNVTVHDKKEALHKIVSEKYVGSKSTVDFSEDYFYFKNNPKMRILFGVNNETKLGSYFEKSSLVELKVIAWPKTNTRSFHGHANEAMKFIFSPLNPFAQIYLKLYLTSSIMESFETVYSSICKDYFIKIDEKNKTVSQTNHAIDHYSVLYSNSMLDRIGIDSPNFIIST